MAKIVGLPKLSPTMEEGTLTKWVKKEGDDIAVDDVIAEVETDKATMEWRSFDRTVLLKILAPEGTTLAADAPIAILGERGDDISSLAGGGAPTPPEPARAAPQTSSQPQPAEAQPSPAGPLGTVAQTPETAPRPNAGGRIAASPSVRRMAREHGVDLHGIEGSGPGGRIIQRDLEAMMAEASSPRQDADRTAQGATPAAAPVGPAGREGRPGPKVIPLTQMRRTIARRLVESKQNVPHFYLSIEARADALMEARSQLNAHLEKSKQKLSLNDLIIKACASALRRVPTVNASFMGDSIHLHQVVDISVAVALPDGLVTPVVRDADRKGLLEIATEVRELAALARDKKLKPEQMSNGTFSVSNLGMYGIHDFQAVINPPEGAILAVGAVHEVPTVRQGNLEVEHRLRMTLSCDHRVIDGAAGAEWLSVLRGMIETPLHLML